MFQQLWTEKVDWDDKLPEELEMKWLKYRSRLPELEAINIPRFYMFNKDHSNVELHAFSDASELAYSTVLYFRSIDDDNNIHVRLIAAKTRVAPLKKITLPRLELLGATLLANFVKYVQGQIKVSNLSVYAWCDSKIVLAWLSSSPQKWKPFISNRTSQILEILPRTHWNYVRSKENPADAASRGITPQELQILDIWWSGPPWLQLQKSMWPINSNHHDTTCSTLTNLELRKSQVITNVSTPVNDTLDEILNHWSSFQKIKRIISYLLSMRLSLKSLNVIDRYRHAEMICIRYVQQQEFSSEIQCLKRGKEISSKSKLMSLSPFIDENNILRVGGRLTKSSRGVSQKHPVILPKGHLLSRLIIRDYHLMHSHPGSSLLTSLIKQKYWIMDCKNTARFEIRKCMSCLRYNARQTCQMMGNLPLNRITPSRPFLITGVDYAGPIQLKSRNGRGNIPVTKGYISLFICQSVKAVHIELVTDLTTEAYLAALRRFISRRGVPSEIHSDNGTNFTGAQTEIKKQLKLFQSQDILLKMQEYLTPQEIKFKFIPPRAPHFGGIWESNIKSMKSHLNRVTNNAIMTYEEMATLLTQIESVLNSRPLCPMSEDPHDLNALTPGHFLIGTSLSCIPEPNLEHVPVNRLSRWQNIQSRFQSYWQKWSLEYLHTLQNRPKWQRQHNNLQVGDMVLVMDDHVPPCHWILGRVIIVNPGNDNLVRVVTLKTKSGELTRPVVKLCHLPISQNQSQESSTTSTSGNCNDESVSTDGR